MSRCNDCDACMWDRKVKFYKKYLCFLCDTCFKKREAEWKKRNL